MLRLVVPRKEPVLEVEVHVPEEERVRVGRDEVLVVELVHEDVVDHRV
jgi:hypothetical protein